MLSVSQWSSILAQSKTPEHFALSRCRSMPSRCRTAAWAARHDHIVERVFASAQSIIPARSCQNGSSGRVAALGSAPVTISPSIFKWPRSAMSAYCRSTRDFAGCDRLTEGSEKQCSRIRLLPPAASSRRMNWRSVACSAESGMLLMRPMVRTASASFCGRSNSSASRGCLGAKAGLTVSGCFSNRMLIPGPAGLFCGLKPLMSRTCLCESLVDVFDDVGIVFDADRKPDGFRQNAGDALFFGRHLAVRGRCGMAGEGFRVADIDEPRDQLQRIVEGLAGFEAAFDPECKQR